MSKPSSTWRAWQLNVARFFGGRNVGGLGGHDVEAGLCDIEVKHGKKMPVSILKAWAQTLSNCRKGHTPVLVLHPHGYKKEDCLVIINMETAKKWLPMQET